MIRAILIDDEINCLSSLEILLHTHCPSVKKPASDLMIQKSREHQVIIPLLGICRHSTMQSQEPSNFKHRMHDILTHAEYVYCIIYVS